jgi:hypothetical protein
MIDRLENLKEDDIETLTAIIKNLHSSIKKQADIKK